MWFGESQLTSINAVLVSRVTAALDWSAHTNTRISGCCDDFDERAETEGDKMRVRKMQVRKMQVRLGMLLGILCTSAISTAVFADDADGPASPAESNVAVESSPGKRTTANNEVELGEVVVTARKRDEKLLDVPETIAAFSAPDIAAKGIETADDLGRQVSNLQFGMRDRI